MLPSLAGVGLTEILEGDIEKVMKYLLSRFAGLFIAVTLLLSSLLGYGTAPALAAVGLTSFKVTPGSNDHTLVVTWTTETERDMVAFQLKRGTVDNANTAAVVATLPALGQGVGGSSYEYSDDVLTSGQPYYYWLYEVKTNGDVSPIGERISGTPGQTGPTATPTNTQSAAATSTPTTRPATATPTATTQATQANNAPANTATFTPVPTNTSVPTNTPVPTNTSAAAAAANAPAATDAPPAASTPANPEAVATTANPTDAGAPETQPAPAIDGEQAPATDGERAESLDLQQVIPSSPTAEGEAAAPTGLTSVDTPTAQAVAQVEAAPTSVPESQPTVARPTATPRPSQSGESSSTTGLLAVIGGGSLCAAALLALVAIFIWRRR